MTADAAAPALWRVETTVPTQAQARALARRVVEQRLAACAQIEPIDSLYHWHGGVVADPEYRVVLKTTAARYAALAAAIREHHPYEVPEIMATAAVACDATYARWVAEYVGQEAGLANDG